MKVSKSKKCSKWIDDTTINPVSGKKVPQFKNIYRGYSKECDKFLDCDTLFGLKNIDASCYIDSVIMAIFARQNDFIDKKILYKKTTKETSRQFQAELQNIVASIRYNKNIDYCLNIRAFFENIADYEHDNPILKEMVKINSPTNLKHQNDLSNYFGRQEPGGPLLRTLSQKYYDINAICNNSYYNSKTDQLTEDKGIVFIYHPEFVKGSGAVINGLILEENGYKNFMESNSDAIFSSTIVSEKTGPCSSSNRTIVRKLNIDKGKKYVLLTSDTTRAQLTTIFLLLNSYENRYGEYLQVVIGSRFSREGINIMNGMKMIMVSGSWNLSSYIQARDRIFRATSHNMRLEDVRKENPAAMLKVKTYNMSSIWKPIPRQNIPQSEWAFMDSYSQDFNRTVYATIDSKMYTDAEDKDRAISVIMRIMKTSSIDCWINRRRNIRTTDIPGSATCDYDICKYTCSGIDKNKVKDLDYTTKILYYSQEEIRHAITHLKQIFSKYYSLTLTQIHTLLKSIDSIYIDMAIERLVNENIKIISRMGFYNYLRESQDGVIFLEKDQFNVKSMPENAVYNSSLIGTQDKRNNTFKDFKTNFDKVNEKPLIMKIIKMTTFDDVFATKFNSLSLMSKVEQLELALRMWFEKGIQNPYYNKIREMFNHAWFLYKEPRKELIDHAKIN